MLLMLYLIAITAEAMTGALSAGRRGMDWFGVVLIACVTALGGGSVRDVRIPRH
ncbi:trimeric intracellular cation channel family protein, partial [Pseudomonas syringae]